MIDSIGTTEWTYNDIGRLTSTDDPWDFTHALTYNAEGFITQMTCEGDTRNYAWNSAGQMTSATRDSKITTFDYNDASWINGINGSNDVDTDYTYNSRGWMTDIEVEDTTTTLLDLDYVYDANGNVTSEDVGDETWTYTYDALNRLTNVNKPGTDDDIIYTYDVRGNRTDIDVGGTDNTDLTFNIADRLTRVDYEDNSYRIYTHDDNGNCTKEEFYSGQYLMSPVVVPTLSSPTSQGGTKGGLDWNSLTREEQHKLKEELLAENEEQQAKRKHYPFTHAPKELLRTKYLSPYLPETTEEDFYIYSMLDWTNPALANLKRAERWRPDRNTATSTTGISNPLSPNATFPADEETHYEYDQANRLTKATLPSGVEIEFEYDGIGRRLKKTITDDTGTGSEDIIETTIKYHYIGGQLTTIEIDEETTDDSDPPVDTTTKDETIHIHLGPNSQPISFEWVRYDYTEEETLDDTYWFHYDIHGNVLKVTDDTQTTKITYTYDTLGQLTTETNPDSIPNFFKFRGVTQTLHDGVLDMYSNVAGFYQPDSGTMIQNGGEQVFENPTTDDAIESMSKSTFAHNQNMDMGKGAGRNNQVCNPAWRMLVLRAQAAWAKVSTWLTRINWSAFWEKVMYGSTWFYYNSNQWIDFIAGWAEDIWNEMIAFTAYAFSKEFWDGGGGRTDKDFKNSLSVRATKEFMNKTFGKNPSAIHSLSDSIMDLLMKKSDAKYDPLTGSLSFGGRNFEDVMLKLYGGGEISCGEYFQALTLYSFEKADEFLSKGYTLGSKCDTNGGLAAEYDAVHGANAHLERDEFESWLINRLLILDYMNDPNSNGFAFSSSNDGSTANNQSKNRMMSALSGNFKTVSNKKKLKKAPHMVIRKNDTPHGFEIGPPIPIILPIDYLLPGRQQ